MKLDGLKWILIVVIIAAGLWLNYHYYQIDWALRLAGWIVLACLLAFIALQTAAGKQVWAFAKEAKIELRKVVWPTRKETTQTTFIIIGMVIVMALVLWAIDSILLWIVSLLTH